jgi:integrase
VEQIQLFLKSCRSPATRNAYETAFKKYVQYVGQDKLFYDNPKDIESKIIDFILSLRDQGKSYQAIENYLDPIKAFYRINDVVLNVHKINKFLPEQVKINRDRAYTHEEISKMLEIADERMRVVILVLASSGIRIGAISSIKLRHLEDAKLTIYENSNEEYITFISPECKKAVDFYLDFRQRYGEKITDNSYLIRDQFDIRNPGPQKPVHHKSIQWNLRVLAIKCGIRKNAHKHARQEVMMSHGFRKFFMNQLVNIRINPEIREMLLGHKIGLASAYYRPTEDEMYDEYEKAIDSLTINEENRLRKKVETLEIEKSRIDMLETKIQQLEKKHGKIR